MHEPVASFRTSSVQTGRPTRETARRRQEELLERALEMFASSGFELTTIEAIAGSLNMTKRTIYSRYKDKAALFEAAMSRAIDVWRVPISAMEAADKGDLDSALVEIARLRIASNLSVPGVRIQRVVSTEAHRFPEIFRKYEQVTVEAILFLVALLRKYLGEQARSDLDLEIAAASFLTLVNMPVRSVQIFGTPPPQQVIEVFPIKAVDQFLNGVRPR